MKKSYDKPTILLSNLIFMCGCGCQDQEFIQIGHKVPNFCANSYFQSEFKEISLNSFEGKWKVLFFYPLDFSSVCNTEVVELSKRAKEFENLNSQILAISVDSVFTHQAWCKEIGELNFPMISDLTREIADEYNVLHDKGMALRATFVIDDQNVLRAYMVNDLSLGRNIDEVKRVLEAAKLGEYCPVNWTKGKGTLGKV